MKTDSMGMEWQQRGARSPHHGPYGEGSTQPGGCEVRQVPAAKVPSPALATQHLMNQVCSQTNLERACQRVRANGGAPGIDGMSVDALPAWLATNQGLLIERLQQGTYQPTPVRGVRIPKPGGGSRQLGIPTVGDRLVQHAILQVLEPWLDPTFSESSYGFRPKRSAHQALHQAARYVVEGYRIVVDLDLEQFFDRVNHDVLMARLARHVGDPCLLGLIRRFLQAGLFSQGVCIERDEGTPQGGPLSPLMANLLLDDLDKELEQRGHRFCRYADDCNIYVRTLVAGRRVKRSVTRFLEQRLKLKVNEKKSAVARVDERPFLGYRLREDGTLAVASHSLERVKEHIRQITRRTRGVSVERVIHDLKGRLPGWVRYFRYEKYGSVFRGLDQWIRRRLRCYVLKQKKRPYTVARFLHTLGVPIERAWSGACQCRRWWKASQHPAVKEGMNVAWFNAQGLVSLTQQFESLQLLRKPPYTMSTYGGVGGRGT